jgi:hypothetical protein
MTLSEYFALTSYKPKFEFGSRVFGHYKKIPFIGSVGSDSKLNDKEGPMLTITLDLPIRIDGVNHYVIKCKHKDVKKLKEF